MVAAYHGNLSLFQEVFNLVDNKNPKLSDYPYTTTVHVAARFGHLPILKLILDTLEDKIQDHPKVQTILHIAAQFKHLDVFKFVFDQVEDKV